MAIDTREEPYFNLGDLTFDVTSEAVHTARDDSWYARTNYGLAVLRYAEANAILKDRRFQQGTRRWPEKVKAEATEGVALISERSWSRTARHSTCTAETAGVLKSSARRTDGLATSNSRDVSVGAPSRKRGR